MSFDSNFKKPYVEPRLDQCEMVRVTMLTDGGDVDVQCLDPAVGTVPESGHVRVCAACADEMRDGSWLVEPYVAPYVDVAIVGQPAGAAGVALAERAAPPASPLVHLCAVLDGAGVTFACGASSRAHRSGDVAPGTFVCDDGSRCTLGRGDDSRLVDCPGCRAVRFDRPACECGGCDWYPGVPESADELFVVRRLADGSPDLHALDAVACRVTGANQAGHRRNMLERSSGRSYGIYQLTRFA